MTDQPVKPKLTGRGGPGRGQGRPKGIIDRRSLKLQERLADLKYDPVQRIIDFTRSADEQVALRAAIAIFEATTPKLKAVEVETESKQTRPEVLTREALQEIENRFIRPQAPSPENPVVH